MINYYLITKPGIILGNLITVAAGFLLASKGLIDYGLFLATLLGLSCIIASACVFNNYIDRKADQKMERTRKRALATGALSVKSAITFAVILGLVGNLILLFYTNGLTVAVANFGFLMYVILYSFWKSQTIYGTAIGSISGAVPPVVGYCAVTNDFDSGVLILFGLMVFWQMPHFFAIAMYRFDDYKAAGIPVLPVMRGVFKTKIHMVAYILAFILTASLLTLFNYTGNLYLIVVNVLGLTWLLLCLKGFDTKNNTLWGKHMFQFSLVVITALCFVIPLDIV